MSATFGHPLVKAFLAASGSIPPLRQGFNTKNPCVKKLLYVHTRIVSDILNGQMPKDCYPKTRIQNTIEASPLVVGNDDKKGWSTWEYIHGFVCRFASFLAENQYTPFPACLTGGLIQDGQPAKDSLKKAENKMRKHALMQKHRLDALYISWCAKDSTVSMVRRILSSISGDKGHASLDKTVVVTTDTVTGHVLCIVDKIRGDMPDILDAFFKTWTAMTSTWLNADARKYLKIDATQVAPYMLQTLRAIPVSVVKKGGKVRGEYLPKSRGDPWIEISSTRGGTDWLLLKYLWSVILHEFAHAIVDLLFAERESNFHDKYPFVTMCIVLTHFYAIPVTPRDDGDYDYILGGHDNNNNNDKRKRETESL